MHLIKMLAAVAV